MPRPSLTCTKVAKGDACVAPTNLLCRARPLLSLDAGVADDLAPPHHFRLEEGRTLRRGVDDSLITERCEALLHVRELHHLCDLAMEQRHDLRGRPGGHDDNEPRFACDLGVTGFRHCGGVS